MDKLDKDIIRKIAGRFLKFIGENIEVLPYVSLPFANIDVFEREHTEAKGIFAVKAEAAFCVAAANGSVEALRIGLGSLMRAAPDLSFDALQGEISLLAAAQPDMTKAPNNDVDRALSCAMREHMVKDGYGIEPASVHVATVCGAFGIPVSKASTLMRTTDIYSLKLKTVRTTVYADAFGSPLPLSHEFVGAFDAPKKTKARKGKKPLLEVQKQIQHDHQQFIGSRRGEYDPSQDQG